MHRYLQEKKINQKKTHWNRINHYSRLRVDIFRYNGSLGLDYYKSEIQDENKTCLRCDQKAKDCAGANFCLFYIKEAHATNQTNRIKPIRVN